MAETSLSDLENMHILVSLLPKDIILRTYSTSLQLVIYAVWRR